MTTLVGGHSSDSDARSDGPTGFSDTPSCHLLLLDGNLGKTPSSSPATTLSASVSGVAPGGAVIADLAYADVVDSAELRTLIVTRQHLRAAGGDMIVRNPSPAVADMLDRFGFSHMIEAPDVVDKAPSLPAVAGMDVLDVVGTKARYDRASWRHFAACRHVDLDLFFPTGTTEGDLEQTMQAKAVCADCPVRASCLQFALTTRQDDGVWGGYDEQERRSLRTRQRAANLRVLA